MKNFLQVHASRLRRLGQRILPAGRQQARIRQLTRERDWIALSEALQSSPANDSPLARHAQQCAAALPNLHRIHADREAHQSRLSAALGEAVIIKQVSRLDVPGRIALGYSRIIAQSETRLLDVFEKNFAPSRQLASSREVALLTSGLAGKLAAPTLLGYAYGDGLISHYYVYLPELQSVRDRFAELQLSILLDQWQTKPTEALESAYPTDPVERMLKRDHASWRAIASAAPNPNLDDATNIDLIRTVYRSLPKCVVNRDLRPDNLGLSSGKLYVVDWDKWTISRCGYGLPLTASYVGDSKIAALYQTAQTRLGVPASAILVSTLLYNIHTNVATKRPIPNWLTKALWTNVLASRPA